MSVVAQEHGFSPLNSEMPVPVKEGAVAKKVFIVDDSSTARQSIKLKLEEVGYEVIEAVDGLEAKEMICNLDINLLITDFDMPRMNGVELVRAVRQMKGKNFLPILILSSNKEDKNKKEANGLGVAGWLDKGEGLQKLPKMARLLIGV